MKALLLVYFCLNLNSKLIFCSDFCKLTKLRIFDRQKFPDSRFNKYLSHSSYNAYEARLNPDNSFLAWYSGQIGVDWVQVDLGKRESVYA